MNSRHVRCDAYIARSRVGARDQGLAWRSHCGPEAGAVGLGQGQPGAVADLCRVQRYTVTGAGHLLPPASQQGVMQIASFGQCGPAAPPRGGAVLHQRFGVRVTWTCCFSTSGPAGHHGGCTAPRSSSQGNDGRAPSINIGEGRSALEPCDMPGGRSTPS